MNRLKLTTIQLHKWLTNVGVFLIPMFTNYLGYLGTVLMAEGHVFSFSDFIPNSFVMGGIAYYLQSILLDYGKKTRK